jgi:hypothetical protein
MMVVVVGLVVIDLLSVESRLVAALRQKLPLLSIFLQITLLQSAPAVLQMLKVSILFLPL